jgi:FMN phosphatase YigB (HAD superfamily)
MLEIRAVLFDLDDTLHDDTYAFTTAAEEVAAEVAAEHGIDALALKRAYVAEAEGFWHRLTASELQTKLSHLRTTMWGWTIAIWPSAVQPTTTSTGKNILRFFRARSICCANSKTRG